MTWLIAWGASLLLAVVFGLIRGQLMLALLLALVLGPIGLLLYLVLALSNGRTDEQALRDTGTVPHD